jgi:hypothetical protein
MLNEYGFSPPMQDILESLLAAKKINVRFHGQHSFSDNTSLSHILCISINNLTQIAELDNRFVTELKNMPESTAIAALHEFSQLDTSRVRNVPGYIIGISKKVGPTRRGWCIPFDHIDMLPNCLLNNNIYDSIDDYDPFDAASKSDAYPSGVSMGGGGGGMLAPAYGTPSLAPSVPSSASGSGYPVKRSRFDNSAPMEAPHHAHIQHQQPQPMHGAFGGPGAGPALGGGDLRDRIDREIEKFIRTGQLIPEVCRYYLHRLYLLCTKSNVLYYLCA